MENRTIAEGDYTGGWGWSRHAWWIGGLVGVALTALVWQFDGPARAGIVRFAGNLPGDLRREWSALQQYGQGTLTVVALLIVWIMDPPHRRLLLRFILAAAVLAATVTGAKVLLGRPRPLLGDADSLVGVFGVYPIPQGDGSMVLAHSWERAGSPELWSMPSSHTAFAVLLSILLVRMYWKLWPIVTVLAALVGTGRMVFDAHWPSDVVAGATAGWVVGYGLLGRGGRGAGIVQREHLP